MTWIEPFERFWTCCVHDGNHLEAWMMPQNVYRAPILDRQERQHVAGIFCVKGCYERGSWPYY